MSKIINEKFPVKDITFTSGRMQGDWGNNEVTTAEGYFIENQQVSITLESVIKYLRNRETASIESNIFSAVINYLEEYRLLKIELRHKEESVENEVSNEENSSTDTESDEKI